MAIDTMDKRASALGLMAPSRRTLPAPASGITTSGQRAWAIESYAGITLTPPPVPPLHGLVVLDTLAFTSTIADSLTFSSWTGDSLTYKSFVADTLDFEGGEL